MAEPALDEIRGIPFSIQATPNPCRKPFGARLGARDAGACHDLDDAGVGGFQAPRPEVRPGGAVAEAMDQNLGVRWSSRGVGRGAGQQSSACYKENRVNYKENHVRPHVSMPRATGALAIVLGADPAGHDRPHRRTTRGHPRHLGGATSGPAPAHRQLGATAGRTREERRGGGHRPPADSSGRGERRAGEVLRYWGLAEYTLNVDTQKLGLWPGGFLNVQGMSSFGQNVNNASGAIESPNFVSLLPEPGGAATGLMNLTFMQFFSKHFPESRDSTCANLVSTLK